MFRAAAVVCCLGLAVGVLAEEAAAPKAAADGAIVVTEAENGKEVVAWVGRTVEVRLEGDQPRTGWEAGDVTGGGLEFLGMEQKAKAGAADKAIGTYTFRYKVAKEGAATLRMSYVSPGGPEIKARSRTALVRSFSVTVQVKPAAALSFGAPAR